MNKKEARAILAFQSKVTKALEVLVEKLSQRELESANAYYAAHIRSIVNGNGYMTLPVGKAQETLGE